MSHTTIHVSRVCSVIGNLTFVCKCKILLPEKRRPIGLFCLFAFFLSSIAQQQHFGQAYPYILALHIPSQLWCMVHNSSKLSLPILAPSAQALQRFSPTTKGHDRAHARRNSSVKQPPLRERLFRTLRAANDSLRSRKRTNPPRSAMAARTASCAFHECQRIYRTQGLETSRT